MYYQLEQEIIDKVGLTAAALYGYLIARWTLSERNGSKFADAKGTYCRMSRKEMCEHLHKSRPTITKAMRALRAAGLIKEKRIGLGSTNKIYLCIKKNTSLPTKKKSDCSPEGKKVAHGDNVTTRYTKHIYSNQQYTPYQSNNPALMYSQRTYKPHELDHVYTDIMAEGFEPEE